MHAQHIIMARLSWYLPHRAGSGRRTGSLFLKSGSAINFTLETATYQSERGFKISASPVEPFDYVKINDVSRQVVESHDFTPCKPNKLRVNKSDSTKDDVRGRWRID